MKWLDITMSGIGKKIEKVRKARGLTQKELGRMVGFSQSYISEIELGDKVPSDTVIVAIADALGDEFLVIDSCNKCVLRSYSVKKHFPEIDLRRRSRISVMTRRIKALADEIDQQGMLVESLHASSELYRTHYMTLHSMEQDLVAMADILLIVTEKLAGVDIADSGIPDRGRAKM